MEPTTKLFSGRPTRPAVEKIISTLLEGAADGQLFTHTQLELLVGSPRHDGHYRAVIAALRREVGTRLHWTLLSEPGVGYRKPTGEEDLRNGTLGLRRLGRRVGKCVHQITRIPDERLTDEARSTRDRIGHNAWMIAETVKQQMKAIDLTTRPTATTPRMMI